MRNGQPIEFRVTAWEPIHLTDEAAEKLAKRLGSNLTADEVKAEFDRMQAIEISAEIAKRLKVENGGRDFPAGVFSRQGSMVGMCEEDGEHFVINSRHSDLIKAASAFAQVVSK